MKIPYNEVVVHRDILFAARGGKIHSFNLINGDHLSTWNHPEILEEPSKEEARSQSPGNVAEEPSPKRQKTASDDDQSSKQVSNEGRLNAKYLAHRNGKSKSTTVPISTPPTHLIITHLVATEDGSHVVAITGHDKTLWVFEHTGKGQISQLSQRALPKRPCAIAIASDSHIIYADKFGDVYSLPLIVDESSTQRQLPSNSLKAFAAPAASALTVHSKRNREALQHQLKQAELDKQTQDNDLDKSDGTDFELTLLLGHVSMLTGLVLAQAKNRKYIITSDRDEHVRVSRHAPQSHIIEGFCFGHKEFISALVLPRGRSELLVSGGGDEELFVWDWEKQLLLSRANVLSLAREIDPSLSKVAVTSLHSLIFASESGEQTYVLAICEGIQAIFTWQLTSQNQLKTPVITQLPGNPLSFSVAEITGQPPKIIAAIDPGAQEPCKSIHIFTMSTDGGRLVVDTDSTVRDDKIAVDEPELSEADVRALLYTVENLRKQITEGDDKGAELGASVTEDTTVTNVEES